MDLNDIRVQVALIAGGAVLVGALVGALGAWIVARANRAEAREARLEARRDATAAMFLQERRAAIVAALTMGEAATREAERTAWHATAADSPAPRSDLLDDFRRAWLELILLAPDLSSGQGGAYSVAVARAAGAYSNWAFERLADAQAGRDLEPRPRAVTEAADTLDEARVAFLVAAMKHLGVPDYAQPDMDVLLGNWSHSKQRPA